MKNYKELLNDAEALLNDGSHNVTGKMIAAATIGLAAGAVLGLLFAPASGTETRDSISESLSNTGEKIKDKARQSMDKFNDLKNQTMETITSKMQGSGSQQGNPAV